MVYFEINKLILPCFSNFVFQYQGAPLEYTDILSDCNLVFTILFTIECVMKLSSFGPKVSRQTKARQKLQKKQ